MTKLSAHFDSSEFGGIPDKSLVLLLEELRRMHGGKPLRIVSGIRSPEVNAQVGGAKQSQHLIGRAADIPYGYTSPRAAARAGFTGIGISADGKYALHVDVRTGFRAAWRYTTGGTWFSVPWPG